jgi:molybdopterin converting factor subunit 1
MTDVRIRFFASLRESVGLSELVVAVPAGTTDLETLLGGLQDQLPTAALAQLRAPSVRIAVNRTLIEGNVAVNAGDEIAFLPPVTGG